MRKRRRQWFALQVLVGVLVSCDGADVPTQAVPRSTLELPTTASATLTTIGGEEYYADEESGELVPTQIRPARIEQAVSTAALSCADDACSADYTAAHKGMWHWSAQTMNWKIEDPGDNSEIAGGSVPKSAGAGCDSWLNLGVSAFCYLKKQNNSHHANAAPVHECRVRAKLTTDHMAGWGLVGSVSAGVWSTSILSFGEVSTSSTGSSISDTCELPDPRFSMASQSQQSGQGGALTVSAFNTVVLTNTTTDFGVPAATNATWFLDGSQIATGNGTSVALPAGTYTVALRLDDGAENEAEVTASLTFVDDSEAGSCDDPLTDVVEINCDGEGDGGEYGAGGVSQTGTQYCYELDWYHWNESLGQYEYWYTQVVSCWYAQ